MASKESDVIRYFTSRRRMIEIADSFLTDFSDIKTLTAFLLSDKQNEDASVSSSSSSSETTARSPMKNALKQILKYLKEADELGVPDAEGVVSDAEIAINDDLQSKRRSGGSLDRERVKQLIENQVVQISSTLGMNQEEEDDFTKAVFEGLISSSSSSTTFEFDRRRLRVVLERLEGEAHGGAWPQDGESGELAQGFHRRNGQHT